MSGAFVHILSGATLGLSGWAVLGVAGLVMLYPIQALKRLALAGGRWPSFGDYCKPRGGICRTLMYAALYGPGMFIIGVGTIIMLIVSLAMAAFALWRGAKSAAAKQGEIRSLAKTTSRGK